MMRRLLLLALVVALPACARPDPPPATLVADGFHHPREGLITGGQPVAEDWLMLRGRKVSTVINLRTAQEMAGRDEAAEVAAAGLTYHLLPVDGAGDIDAAHADTLWRLIEDAPGRVMVHCASGNRVGALLAIGAVRHAGMSAEQALAFGRAAGLTRLEPVVRKQLGLPPAASAGP